MAALGERLEAPGIGVWAFLGNLAGAAIFVSAASWFLYLRDDDEDEVGPTDAEPEQARSGNGRARTYGPLTRR